MPQLFQSLISMAKWTSIQHFKKSWRNPSLLMVLCMVYIRHVKLWTSKLHLNWHCEMQLLFTFGFVCVDVKQFCAFWLKVVTNHSTRNSLQLCVMNIKFRWFELIRTRNLVNGPVFVKSTKKERHVRFVDLPLWSLRLANYTKCNQNKISFSNSDKTNFQDFGEETPALDVVKDHLRQSS